MLLYDILEVLFLMGNTVLFTIFLHLNLTNCLMTYMVERKENLVGCKENLKVFLQPTIEAISTWTTGFLDLCVFQPSLLTPCHYASLNFCGTKNAISSIMCSNLTAFTVREWVLNSSKWQNTSSLVPVINVSIYLPKRQRDVILGRNEQRSVSAYPRIMLMDSYQLTENTVILFGGISYITWVNSVIRLILSINNTAMF